MPRSGIYSQISGAGPWASFRGRGWSAYHTVPCLVLPIFAFFYGYYLITSVYFTIRILTFSYYKITLLVFFFTFNFNINIATMSLFSNIPFFHLCELGSSTLYILLVTTLWLTHTLALSKSVFQSNFVTSTLISDSARILKLFNIFNH